MKVNWSEPPGPRKRRDRLYIIAEILTVAKDGSLKTQIMYRANLSFAQLNEYLSFLLKMKLLKVREENGRTVYKVTAKGTKFLQNYEEIIRLLNQDDENSAKVSSPIFWLKRTA